MLIALYRQAQPAGVRYRHEREVEPTTLRPYKTHDSLLIEVFPQRLVPRVQRYDAGFLTRLFETIPAGERTLKRIRLMFNGLAGNRLKAQLEELDAKSTGK